VSAKPYGRTTLASVARGEDIVRGFKPICCGNRQEAERLLAASARDLTIEGLFIHSGLKNAGVEGVGGWLVPIRAELRLRLWR
jgi:hypothetical protein